MALKLATCLVILGSVHGNPMTGWYGPEPEWGPAKNGHGTYPVQKSYPGCTDFFVDVPVEYEYFKTKFPPYKNQQEATQAALSATSRTPGNPVDAIDGPFNGSSTFKISARYCPSTSKSSGNTETMLLLSHGLGFDKSYWSFDYPVGKPNNYSFTYNANAAGFSTLSYDRLGCGQSSKPDPYNIVQSQVELALLTEITTLVRSGKLNKAVPKPTKLVHMGHSYGSLLSNGIVATAPSLTDAVIFTGYSNVFGYQGGFITASAYHIAAYTDPARFGGLQTGYLTWRDATYAQYSFFYYPAFDVGVLNQAEATKWPFTQGEFLTQQNVVPDPAKAFDKPVLLMAASNDLIFCGANCTHSLLDGPAAKAYPVAKPLDVYIQPNTGHGMNLHYNATGWYDYVFNWLGDQGF